MLWASLRLPVELITHKTAPKSSFSHVAKSPKCPKADTKEGHNIQTKHAVSHHSPKNACLIVARQPQRRHPRQRHKHTKMSHSRHCQDMHKPNKTHKSHTSLAPPYHHTSQSAPYLPSMLCRAYRQITIMDQSEPFQTLPSHMKAIPNTHF